VNNLKAFFSSFDSLRTWKFLLVFALGWLVVSQPYNGKNGFKVIEWDVTHYYSYLPALVIHQDLKFEKNWTKNLDDHHLSFETDENGNRYLKMTSGMALMYSPFFFLAHGLTSVISLELATGYTRPYRIALSFGSLLYVLIGLWFLRKVLLRFANDKSVSWALLIVFLGTNLFHYTIYRGAMSHGYSLMLSCLFLNLMFRYIDKPKYSLIMALGFISGLVVLIRPVNGLIPLFLGSYMLIKILQEKRELKVVHIILFILFAIVAVSPQLFIWKYQTRNWLLYSYNEEGFFFNDPQIINGLFSFRKGWLIYSPLMVLPIIGIALLFKKDKILGVIVALLLVTTLYITFSWWCWWYGGSFGARPLIEYYGILAIPLVLILQWLLNVRRSIKRISFVVISLLVALSVFQNYQYQCGIIHFDSMSKEAYWNVFLKDGHQKGYDQSLKSPDYKKALKGDRD
jgi:hypothetical protein